MEVPGLDRGHKKYATDPDTSAIAGIVRYCGTALQNKDSSLVSFSDKDEVTRVRTYFLKTKLGLTEPDADLDKTIMAVADKMRGERGRAWGCACIRPPRELQVGPIKTWNCWLLIECRRRRSLPSRTGQSAPSWRLGTCMAHIKTCLALCPFATCCLGNPPARGAERIMEALPTLRAPPFEVNSVGSWDPLMVGITASS